jgi:hypothetical protein
MFLDGWAGYQELLRAAMQDNIKLAMADVDCWVSKFMKFMVQMHVISQ